MWGADDAIYFVADPLPNEKNVKPGSPEVRASVNNIYKIPVKGGQPVQVTKHADGSLFWPSMSSDGKVIVYEDNFGIWKLDVASGRTNEIKIDIDTDEKENEDRVVTVNDEVDNFDISPSGRRAAISVRGQILTIATERGDITRVNPDQMASRNQTAEMVGRRQVHRLPVGSIGPRRNLDLRSRGPHAEEDHRPRQREGRADLDAGLEVAALYRRPASASTTTASPTARPTVVTSQRYRADRIRRRSRPTASGSRSRSRTARCARTSTSRRLAAAKSATSRTTALLYAENEAVWTADGQYLVFTSTEGFSNGIATQGGINATTELWVLSLRDRDRDPDEPRHRQRSAGAGGAGRGAAERARTGGARRRHPTCGSTGAGWRGGRSS